MHTHAYIRTPCDGCRNALCSSADAQTPLPMSAHVGLAKSPTVPPFKELHGVLWCSSGVDAMRRCGLMARTHISVSMLQVSKVCRPH